MKQVILTTGPSSGFGALAARALSHAGHIVYAGMWDTQGRNAPQVKAFGAYAPANHVDIRAIELDVALQQSADEAIRRIVTENAVWT
jgi:NAD(P)-dependent dehydrogenase (short-subunit alcohol dehydrogenase family)